MNKERKRKKEKGKKRKEREKEREKREDSRPVGRPPARAGLAGCRRASLAGRRQRGEREEENAVMVRLW